MRILALHSSQSHAGQWRALQHDCKQQWPDVSFSAPDFIGYGRGPALTKLAKDFRFADELAAMQASDLLAGGEPWILIGHSYGGAVALRLARELGPQVRALILYEPVAFHILPEGHAARNEIADVARKMELSSHAEACAAFVDYWNHPGYFASLPARLQRSMLLQQPKVSADFYALFYEPARAEDYANIRCPMWLLQGRDSPYSSRAVADMLAVHVQQCQRVSVDAGHMGPLTHPEQVNPQILQALKTVLPS